MRCFDPRSRTGSDGGSAANSGGRVVSIHAPARGATVGQHHPGRGRLVSIHAPARGATGVQPCGHLTLQSFDPRSRTGSDCRQRGSDDRRSRFRSTLPHGERLELAGLAGIGGNVSIHAPARGATGKAGRAETKAPVSIHAPARGATSWTARRTPSANRFDPRSRTGSDLLCLSAWIFNSSFDPRSRTGSDLPHPRIQLRCSCFDPRSRTGSDGMCPQASASVASFDPRSRTGSDEAGTVWSGPVRVSIHAPARGATRRPRREPPWLFVSIHAPARGATLPRVGTVSAPTCFDPRSRTGSDFGMPRGPPLRCRFDPRSRTGSDATSRSRSRIASEFRSTLPHGERPSTWPARGSCPGFDPRSRTGSDAPVNETRRPEALFRSTLPHGERPLALFRQRIATRVSIHAPARGATCGCLGCSPK